MATNVGIFVDLSNIYYCLQHRYNKKLNYQTLLNFCKDFGDIKIARAYGAQYNKQAKRFIHALTQIGFEPVYKHVKTFRYGNSMILKADCDLMIAMDIVRYINELDVIILCTADSDFLPVINWLKENDKEVIVIASNVSSELKGQVREFFEIPQSFMES